MCYLFSWAFAWKHFKGAVQARSWLLKRAVFFAKFRLIRISRKINTTMQMVGSLVANPISGRRTLVIVGSTHVRKFRAMRLIFPIER